MQDEYVNVHEVIIILMLYPNLLFQNAMEAANPLKLSQGKD